MEYGKIIYKKGLNLLNKSDVVLITILIILSIIIFINQNKMEINKEIEIRIDNNLIASYELNTNRIVEINRGTILEIKNGRFRLIKSNCPRKLCVEQGWSFRQPIICVPQKLVISLTENSYKKKQILTY